jgi:hypothetical protein
MKRLVWYGGLFLVSMSACVLAFLWLTSDVVTSHYATTHTARAQGLFDRGWLPDILPPSATNIRVSNNLDLNDSHGEFDFPLREYAAFVARTSPYRPSGAPFVAYEETVERMRKKGFEARMVNDDGSTWVFICKATNGHCEYDMWHRKR